MKTYIQDLVDELKSGGKPDYTPEIPKTPADGKTNYLDALNPAPAPEDLDNQVLSSDPEEAVRQLDQQAQKSEELQTLG